MSSNDHALLSPSSAYRWMNCPLAPGLEATLPEKTSKYAEEGTIAHSVCEVSAKLHFKKIKKTEYNKIIKKLKTDPSWDDEMLRTADIYAEHLADKAMRFKHEPYIAFEVSVDIADYVPESFGKCDCVMFGENTLIITDYKHGRGVPVKAEENPQLMLYALGALKLYRPLFGDTIKKIEINIDQPRLDSYENWIIEIEKLLEWGESIKPKAQAAFMGIGEYHSGDWCRFCRANGICKAQAKHQTGAFDDFAEAVGKPADILTPEEMSAVLKRGGFLVDWYKAVQEKALAMLLNGGKIPGYKVVEDRSQRVWTDQDKALEKLQESGIEQAVIYDRVPKTLAQIEKLLGKTKFTELVGKFVCKPQGKPNLASIDDSRKEYNSAAADFASAAKNKED